MENLILPDDTFGPILYLVKNENITDINWNGYALWVDDLQKGRYCIPEIRLDDIFVKNFSTKIANLMSVSFNKFAPLLEAETNELRISIVHESVAKTGYTISIRKTPAQRRLTRNKMISDKYCTEALDNFMHNAILAHCNIVVCGLPGVGKTEYIKTLTEYIPDNERAITIEDNLELRYHEINPTKDCVALKVDDDFSYTNAIKACLRQKPVWILLSEARSVEVKYLLESMSTGTYCLTTIHSEDAGKIPARIKNMMPEGESEEKTESDIYSFINLGVHIASNVNAEGGIHRYINEVVMYTTDEKGCHKNIKLYSNGNFTNNALSPEIYSKFKRAGIECPILPPELQEKYKEQMLEQQKQRKVEA